MTPEEHIEMAERIIDNYRNDADALRAAEVHVSIAFFKKQYPPDGGRPVPSSQVSDYIAKVEAECIAPVWKGQVRPRPVRDNPQA